MKGAPWFHAIICNGVPTRMRCSTVAHYWWMECFRFLLLKDKLVGRDHKGYICLQCQYKQFFSSDYFTITSPVHTTYTLLLSLSLLSCAVALTLKMRLRTSCTTLSLRTPGLYYTPLHSHDPAHSNYQRSDQCCLLYNQPHTGYVQCPIGLIFHPFILKLNQKSPFCCCHRNVRMIINYSKLFIYLPFHKEFLV